MYGVLIFMLFGDRERKTDAEVSQGYLSELLQLGKNTSLIYTLSGYSLQWGVYNTGGLLWDTRERISIFRIVELVY